MDLKSLNIVALAYEIIEMNNTIQQQEYEIEELKEYKQKYMDILNDSIKHNEKMMNNTMEILLNPEKYKG